MSLPYENATSGDIECPPLPPARMYHLGAQIDPRGRVSALCFSPPRPINMRRETWTMISQAVTCPKCQALILARGRKIGGPT